MSKKPQALTIRKLLLPKESEVLFPFIKQLNPDITKGQFSQCLKEMLPLGYSCIAAFMEDKPVGICGIWSATRFWCGRYMEVDNVAVDARLRSNGVGAALMQWVEKEARRTQCRLVIADSYTHNTASHRFYFRERYIIKGFCFVKEI